MRILIAEDDSVTRAVLRKQVPSWGYEVELASDGNEAWRILQSPDAPRLVLLDWMMPGMDGPEICRRVRERAQEPYIYILLLTGRGRREDVVHGLAAGADDYVTKPFDRHELEVRLRAASRILRLQDELIAAREAQRELAMRDPLTRLHNRGAVSDSLEREVANAQRTGAPISVLLVDVDYFKHVNDSHGHPAGDTVLRETSARMLSSVRAHDVVGRYGGEEFLIVLPDCDARDAVTVAERTRKRIEGDAMRIDDATTVNVTASLGVASLRGNAASTNGLIAAADAALYAAKAKGRNRVELAPQSAGSPSERAPDGVDVAARDSQRRSEG